MKYFMPRFNYIPKNGKIYVMYFIIMKRASK
jgi:hypothetical protein